MKSMSASALVALLTLSCVATVSFAFPEDGRECAKCHSLSREEAAGLLGGKVDNVVGVVPGPIPGLWEVDVEKGGSVYPAYVDYSKKLLFNGQVIRLSDMENLTGRRYVDLNRVDASTIPLADAIVMGKPSAKRKVVVLSDPDCPHCARLHGEIKKAVAKDPDTAFFVRLYPRGNNPATFRKAHAVMCAGSEAALDDVYAGKDAPAPPASCGDEAVKETIRLAERLRVRGTPTMVLPDGRVVSGAMSADALLSLVNGGR